MRQGRFTDQYLLFLPAKKKHNIFPGKLLQTWTDGYLKKVFSETSVPDPETDPRWWTWICDGKTELDPDHMKLANIITFYEIGNIITFWHTDSDL